MKFMVFDVESIGLHGEIFAVGYVCIEKFEGKWTKETEGRFVCSPRHAYGDKSGHKWVDINCPEMPITHSGPFQIREAFWNLWQGFKKLDYQLVADCSWPCEARFLAQCIDDDHICREWEGPYPLLDLASILFAKGIDPLKKFERTPDEVPEHDPLKDARQSARILMDLLDGYLK